jgi:uncharacterized protein YjeT (DUF2065 family)
LSFEWRDLLTALAFLLVLEGLLPFINPASARRLFAQLASLAERELRVAGLVSMVVGALLLFIIRT